MYLGKNTNITEVIKHQISRHCIKSGSDREDIASQLGIMKGTLDNKLKPSKIDSTFTIEEVIELCKITDDDAVLKAMCEERGLMVFDPIETMPDGGNVISSLTFGVLDIDTMTGSLSGMVRNAIEDNEIDESEAFELMKALRELRAMERKIEVMLDKHRKL